MRGPGSAGQRPGGFADALDRAIARRGVTLVQLRDQLKAEGSPTSLSALSYWRSGERRPEGRRSVAAVADLERLLALEPGTLTHLLPASQQSHIRHREVRDIVQHGDAVSDILTRLGRHPLGTVNELSTHLTMDLDEGGNMRAVTYRTVWRAARPGVVSVPLAVVLDPPIGDPVINRVHGCTIGRTAVDPSRTVFGYELVFPSPLGAGECAITEFGGDIPPGLVDPELGHSVTAPISELLIWARFHPDRVPTSAHAFVARDGAFDSEPVAIIGNDVFSRFAHEPSGRFGIRWAW